MKNLTYTEIKEVIDRKRKEKGIKIDPRNFNTYDREKFRIKTERWLDTSK